MKPEVVPYPGQAEVKAARHLIRHAADVPVLLSAIALGTTACVVEEPVLAPGHPNYAVGATITPTGAVDDPERLAGLRTTSLPDILVWPWPHNSSQTRSQYLGR